MSPARCIGTWLSALCGALLCGCVPSGPGPADEQKEPHFLEGRSRVNAMDYRGAVESFAEALEINPRSASAHFELGWLYEQKDPDPAAAIFHYQRYLKLRPDAVNAETIRQRIQGLKQMLAETVSALPSSALQRELERVMEENRRLREEVSVFQARQIAALTNVPPQPPVRQQVIPQKPVPAILAVNNPSHGGVPATARKHTVQSGESPASIARRYGVKVDALLAANPGLNPKRLQIGRTVNLPAS